MPYTPFWMGITNDQMLNAGNDFSNYLAAHPQPPSSTNNPFQQAADNYFNDIRNGRIKPNPTTGGNTGVPINASQDTPFDFSQILNQATNAYGSNAIGKYFDLARGNLNRSMGNAASFAARSAGAGSTNMLNPSSFILSAISQAQQPYAQQQGQLAVSQAQAQQQGQEKLTQLLYLINRAKQGDQEAANQLKLAYDTGAEQRREYEQTRSDKSAGIWDYLLSGVGAASNAYDSGLLTALGIF